MMNFSQIAEFVLWEGDGPVTEFVALYRVIKLVEDQQINAQQAADFLQDPLFQQIEDWD